MRPGATVEEPCARLHQERARGGPEHGLHDAHQQQVVTGDFVEHCEQVGVERRLVEHLAAQPLTAGDLLGPGVVLTAVTHQDLEDRRAAQLRDRDQAQRQRAGEHSRHPAKPGRRLPD